MAEMTGAQAMFETMAREGVRYVFGNPGTTELPLMDLFAAREDVKYILALHEDSALGIAAGFAEATGRAAVVNLHTNAGLAHALGNLYNAYRAGTPLVVTAGQQDTRAMIDEPLLYADMIALARQHTRWAYEVRTAAEIPAVMAKAFKIAETAPTGPVFVSLPVNLMEETASMEMPHVTRVGPRARGDRAKIEEAARLLSQSRSPVIIAGDGCARSGALDALVGLSETIGARVFSEPLNSLLSFPTGHGLYAGPMFANAKQTRAQLEGADCILTVGVNNLAPLVYTGVKMLPAGARLIQVASDPSELGKNYPADVAILADERACVEELIEAVTPALGGELAEVFRRRKTITAEKIKEARAAFAEQSCTVVEGRPMSAAYVARAMRAAAAPDAALVDESVTSTAFVRVMFELNEPNSYFYAKAGSLGLGLPAAIGVKLAMPDRQVLCAVGDGSALYSIQALWTAARYNVAVVFVVFNNAGYVILKGGLLALGGASVARGLYTGMDITEPEVDFVRLAGSMGVAARRVSQAAELGAALDWALGQSGPTLLDVAISRDVRSVLR